MSSPTILNSCSKYHGRLVHQPFTNCGYINCYLFDTQPPKCNNNNKKCSVMLLYSKGTLGSPWGWTGAPGSLCGVKTADCWPNLLLLYGLLVFSGVNTWLSAAVVRVQSVCSWYNLAPFFSRKPCSFNELTRPSKSITWKINIIILHLKMQWRVS